MKKYENPDIRITYFVTDDTMTEPYPSYQPNPLSVVNIFGSDSEKVQVGSIDFAKLK